MAAKPVNLDILESRLDPTLKIDRSTFVNTNSKCRFVDEVYGELWALPYNAVKSKVHPSRKRERLRLSTLRRIQSKLLDFIKIVPDTFVSSHRKAKFIDDIYGEWWANPSDVVYGKGHPQRSIRSRAESHILTERYIKDNVPDYIEVDYSTYKGARKPMRFVDSVHGEFWSLPGSVMYRGGKHPKRRVKKHTSAIVIQSRLPNNITLDRSTYVDTHTKARFIDSEYGEWWALPYNVVWNKSEHPSKFANRSRGEDELYRFVESLGVRSVRNYRGFRNGPDRREGYELDVFLPDSNIGIEYCGLYWHSEGKIDNRYHLDKRLFFNSIGVKLIQVLEDEWRDKRDLICSMLRHAVGLGEIKVYARKTKVLSVDNDVAQKFLENNHLMGAHRSSKYIGLYHDGELVSLLGYKLTLNFLDISRFCTKMGYHVVGGLSRLLSHVPESKEVRSFVDLRYATGYSLEKIGFTYDHTTLGWRWTDGFKTYNRLRCRANMDERDLPQEEYAAELGWVKIYDAGQALFIKR
jgi:hypothetical protein